MLVKEAFEGGSGRLGGDSNALTHVSECASPVFVCPVRGRRSGGWDMPPRVFDGTFIARVFSDRMIFE